MHISSGATPARSGPSLFPVLNYFTCIIYNLTKYCFVRNVVTALGGAPHPLLVHISLLIFKDPSLLAESVKLMLSKTS